MDVTTPRNSLFLLTYYPTKYPPKREGKKF